MDAAPNSQSDRALGALLGLAIGDATGMPTQDLSRAQILAEYGEVRGLLPAGPSQVIAAGLPAGTVTDDTEQALLLADLLIAGDGSVDPAAFAHALTEWERSMAAKGSLDLLGPSTKRAIERIAAGVPPEQAGRGGTTNGAAMRIAPVGIAVPPEPLDTLLEAVRQASVVTHNTSVGLGAAAAVAAAVSVGIEGGDTHEQLEHASRAAGDQLGPRIAWATAYLREQPAERWPDLVGAVIGTDVAAEQSVVAAFAIVAASAEPWAAVRLAASVGGDTDTIAAIVGAITGARAGTSAWPKDVAAQVISVNHLDLDTRVDRLLHLRHRS